MNYTLRELTRNDIEKINEWRNNHDIIDNLGAPFRYISKDIDESWFSSYLNTRNNNVRLAIVSCESKSMIGAVYLTNIDWISRAAEFAIWIGEKSEQGRGAGRYATTSVLNHAFNDLGLNRVYLTALTENERARALYKKVGFKEEGILRAAGFKNGKHRDMVVMSILASEYAKSRP